MDCLIDASHTVVGQAGTIEEALDVLSEAEEGRLDANVFTYKSRQDGADARAIADRRQRAQESAY